MFVNPRASQTVFKSFTTRSALKLRAISDKILGMRTPKTVLKTVPTRWEYSTIAEIAALGQIMACSCYRDTYQYCGENGTFVLDRVVAHKLQERGMLLADGNITAPMRAYLKNPEIEADKIRMANVQ